MGIVRQGLSLPLDVSLYGTTHTNTELPGYKTKALLRNPATLSSYYGIPPHWISQTHFDWGKALSPFQRPDPWAVHAPPFPSIPPGESGASRPVDQGGAYEPGDASANSTWDPAPVCPSSPLSTWGIPPSPDPEEEERSRHTPPQPPPPSPIPDDGLSIGPLSDTRRQSL